MNFLLLFPAIISLLILGAHYYRSGVMILVMIAALLPSLLFYRKAWVARLMQAVLVLGMIEWVRTLFILVDMRRALGQPWTRLAIIIGTVALFSGCSALLFQSKRLRKRYKLSD